MDRHYVGVVMQRNTEKITKIEEIEFDGYVYDVSCENPHLYLTNDFISHNCILWVDEVEKGIGGVRSSNVTDGGVTNRVFATLLTWMQEKTAPVFIICTANDTRQLPPEFMRAGRFDEIFFLDLPTQFQREEVVQKILRRKGRDPKNFSVGRIAESTPKYSPAELEKGINDALFQAFSDGEREVTTEDILENLSNFQPLYNSKSEDIEEMREWALGEDEQGGNARLANTIIEKKPAQVKKRNISVDAVDAVDNLGRELMNVISPKKVEDDLEDLEF